MRIVVIGGHLSPAYALIKELQKRGHDIYFFGRKRSIEGEKALSFEFEQITKLNVAFISIVSGRLQRKFSIYTIPSLLKIPFGFFQSLVNLIKIRPDAVVSFGGYLSVPVILAAYLLGIKSLTHEQTLSLGLANKINKFFVKKLAVSFEKTLSFAGKKGVCTGNPIRDEVFQKEIKDANLKKFLNQKGKKIFVTGGASGSHKINLLIEKHLEKLLGKYLILHQTGRSITHGDFDRLTKNKSKLSSNLREKYFICEYVEPSDIGGVLNNVDIIISRAGANTTQELLALGKKALLIPISFASNSEQLNNADILIEKKLAKIVLEKELEDVDLLKIIDEVLKLRPNNDGGKLKIGNSTENLVKLVEDLYKL